MLFAEVGRKMVRYGVVKKARREYGMSIIETVFAMAILIAGFSLFLSLFTFSLRSLSKGEERTKAVALADRELARLQSLGQAGNFSGLIGEHGRTFSSDGFEVELQVFDRDLYSPSTSWEQPHIATGDPRHLNPTTVTAIATVSNTAAKVEQARLISRPRRNLRTSPAPLTVDGTVPNPLAARASVHFDAHLYALDGSELPVTFAFYTVPISGNGTIVMDHNGRGATFINEVTDSSGAVSVTGGSCQVLVKAIYYGEEVWGPTITINLGA